MESRRELTDAEAEHQQKTLEENRKSTPPGVKDVPPVSEAEPVKDTKVDE